MKATLEIEVNDPETIKKSLMPDVEKNNNLKIKIKTKHKLIIIEIECEKISHLKAVLNSYLSLIKTLDNLM